jgi:hypothetical protein
MKIEWKRQNFAIHVNVCRRNVAKIQVQLVAKKTGNENFPNVNLILFICQLIVYFTIPVK